MGNRVPDLLVIPRVCHGRRFGGILGLFSEAVNEFDPPGTEGTGRGEVTRALAAVGVVYANRRCRISRN